MEWNTKISNPKRTNQIHPPHPPKSLSSISILTTSLSLPFAFYYHIHPIPLPSISLPPFLPHILHALTNISPTMAAASSAVFSLAAGATSRSHNSGLSPANISFQGLRPLASKAGRASSSSSAAAAPRRSGAIRAELSAPVVISLSTGLSLFLGRFVFFNFQRENVAKQVPEQNGKTHFEAGDVRAQEYVSLLKSNDPVGFNIVDVLAWGSIGHIVAYYILATTSNGYDPSFFG